MKAITQLFFLLLPWGLGAQNTQVLHLKLLCEDQAIDTLQGNQLTNSGELYIINFKFYLSTVKSGQAAKAESVRLVDFKNEPCLLSLGAEDKLYLGVDSLLNAQGIHQGDLDPIKGMYWAWQTGYIHLKLEGWFKSPEGRREEFVFHIGGFNHSGAGPYLIDLEQAGEWKIDLAPVLKWSFQNDIYRILSPGPKADRFARYFVNSIQTK